MYKLQPTESILYGFCVHDLKGDHFLLDNKLEDTCLV